MLSEPDDDYIDDPVKFYLREACSFPPMSSEEERDLSWHIRAGDEQADAAELRLVEVNLPLVVSIAERYQDQGIHILDLIRVGNNAVFLAVKTFAGTPADIRFSTYAAPCIEQAIEEYIAYSKLAGV